LKACLIQAEKLADGRWGDFILFCSPVSHPKQVFGIIMAFSWAQISIAD